MKISLELDKDTLLSSSAVQYKYAVLHHNGKTVWEFVPRKAVFGEYANRILFVPRDRIQQHTGMLLSDCVIPLSQKIQHLLLTIYVEKTVHYFTL